MTTAPTNADHPAFDPMDPHGSTHAGGHHGHVIVPWQTQLGILVALLVLTALTVFVSQAEIYIAHMLDITIPNWVNIVGAMLIATVKATLVCLYFMQLRFDKPLNSIVFASCLFCVFLFLFFSMIDLANRDRVLDYKSGEVVAGGTGKDLNLVSQDPAFAIQVGPRPNTGGVSIVDHVHEIGIGKKESPKKFWKKYYDKYLAAGETPHRHPKDTDDYFTAWAHDHERELHERGIHVHLHAEPSTAQQSRPRTGLTPGLFDDDPHAHSHDKHDADKQREDDPDAGANPDDAL